MLPTEKIYGIQSSHIFMKIRKDSCGWLWAVYEWAIYHTTIIIQNKLYDTQYTMQNEQQNSDYELNQYTII